MIKDTTWSYAKQEDETVVRKNRGAGKVVRLCVIGVLLPLLLVTIPLYARFHLTRTVYYPFIPSDQLLLDDHISTFWCQGQYIRANGTFNAWLLGETPKIEKHRHSLRISEKMLMEEDMKEYWGFYLIKGSRIHLKYCARYPGSNIMIVRGAECLRVCAFLQEDEKEGKSMVAKLLEEPSVNPQTKRNSTSTGNVITYRTDVNDSLLIPKQPAMNEISETKTKKVLMEYKNILKDYFQDLKKFKRITPSATRRKAKMMARVLQKLSVPDNSRETHGGETTEDKNTSYVDVGSEQVSSFSSSEESILTCPCQGVQLYYPIIPSRHCDKSMFNDSSNSIEYVVDQDSHYYFIFTNDNELYDNPVAFHLEMDKIRYKISHPIEVCSNVTACNFTLNFISDEKVLFEQPFRQNFSKLNETYQLESSCDPRTYVYLIFYMAIPIIIILVAFA